MGDYVARDKVIATVYSMRKKCDTNDIDDYVELLLGAFEVLCAEDAVPVVRCKNCKYYVARGLFGEERNFCTYIYQRLCGDLNYVEYEPPKYWFCADGERKE